MKNRKQLYWIPAVLVVVATVLVIYAFSIKPEKGAVPDNSENNPQTIELTDELKQQITAAMDQLQASVTENKISDKPIVDHDGIVVTPESFLMYKGNIDYVGELPPLKEQKVAMTNEQILDALLTTQLLAREARSRGITVSESDFNERIKQEKMILEDNEGSGNAFMREIMLQRVRISGVSADEFFQLKETRQEYENMLLQSTLIATLSKEGTINDKLSIEEYSEHLLAFFKQDAVIDWSSVKLD